jgi:uncharacterized protein (TIGR02444 family)
VKQESDVEQQLWRFSLERYDRPHVERLSLELQDRYGFDVNLIFFCLWLADARGEALGHQGIEMLRRAAAPANENLVAPIRAARRWLKGRAGAGTPEDAGRSLYEAVKAIELRCERLVQHALVEQLGEVLPREQAGNPLAAAVASLEAYAALLSADDDVVRTLRELASRTIGQDEGPAGSSLGG